MSPALSTETLCHRFGGIVATDAVSFALEPGARHALIGPNGAGKTTLVNLLTGVLVPTSGRVKLGAEDITALPRHQRVRRGLVRTFQINQLFPDLSPLDAVTVALGERDGLTGDLWRPVRRYAATRAEAAALLASVGLGDVQAVRTDALPYGKQRLLELALALACRPRVLLLDEPAAGMAEEERDGILDIIMALPREVSILLIEHDMDLVFRFAERITVLVHGAILVEGPPAAIAADPRVREAYLGQDTETDTGAGADG
jgi:branched-chain amino acid transport system ATP-binding protein